LVFNRNKTGVGRVTVFGLVCLAGSVGAERREGLKHPPLLVNLGLIATAIPQRLVRLGGFVTYRPDCLRGAAAAGSMGRQSPGYVTADVRRHFNLSIYYLSIVRGWRVKLFAAC
jgi:hypothetical protein